MSSLDFMPGGGSDLAASRGPRAADLGPTAALSATLALGFLEACARVERRPIPLRFALAFALANVAPSAVWSSVPARHVALAVDVPVSRLVLTDAWPPAISPKRAARRILALRTLQALRYVAGSYGLAWGLWRAWHPSEGVAAAGEREERVARVAPVSSPLSRASKAKHGDQVAVLAPPREQWQRAQLPSDWAEFGIRHGESAERILLVEVEVGNEAAAQHAEQVVKAARAEEGELRVVGVVSTPRAEVPSSLQDRIDVCFNPLSAVLKYLAEQSDSCSTSHAIIVSAHDDDTGEATRSIGVQVRPVDVAKGLLFQYGISSTTQQMPNLNQDTLLVSEISKDCIIIVMAPSVALALNVAEKLAENDAFAGQEMCFVVEESIKGKVESSFVGPLVEFDASPSSGDAGHGKRAKWMSIADISDATLQSVREMFRSGASVEEVQSAVYKSYGPQWASSARPDSYSDIGKFI